MRLALAEKAKADKVIATVNGKGVPVKLGKNGVEQIVEIKLTADEQAALKASAEDVKANIAKLNL